MKDCNGNVLSDGDTVVITKTLKVKGFSSDLKKGQVIKKIRIVDDEEHIECKVNGSSLMVKTCYLKKG